MIALRISIPPSKRTGTHQMLHAERESGGRGGRVNYILIMKNDPVLTIVSGSSHTVAIMFFAIKLMMDGSKGHFVSR